MSQKISRRQFFRLHPAQVVVQSSSGPSEKNSEVSLPGFNESKFFSEVCLNCQACESACPVQAVRFKGAESGKLEGQPFLDVLKNPCHWCSDFPCIEVCPHGVLEKKADKAPLSLGVVELNLDHCLNSKGTLCDECIVNCPSHIRAISRAGRFPKMTDSCVGCGLCLSFCSEAGQALVFKKD